MVVLTRATRGARSSSRSVKSRPADQPGADRLDVARAHPIVVDGGVVRRAGGEPLHLHPGGRLGAAEDPVLREAGRRDAGYGTQALELALRELRQPLALEARGRRVHRHDQQPVARQARVHADQRARAPHQHAGADQQGERQRHLEHHQQLAEAEPARAAQERAGGAAAAARAGWCPARPRVVRMAGSSPNSPAVTPVIASVNPSTRQSSRTSSGMAPEPTAGQGEQRPAAPERQQQTERAAQSAEDQALGQQLPHESDARRRPAPCARRPRGPGPRRARAAGWRRWRRPPAAPVPPRP